MARRPVQGDEQVIELLDQVLTAELPAINQHNRGIALSVERSDNGSRELVADILEGEEDHADWLETQLTLIDQLGEAHDLARQIHA